jgi:hypothetical protein
MKTINRKQSSEQKLRARANLQPSRPSSRDPRKSVALHNCCGTASLLVAALIGVAGCEDRDPNWAAHHYQVGRTEAELRRDVGPPTRERMINPRNEHQICNAKDSAPERELIYEISSRGVGKSIRDTLGISASVWIVVCVERSRRITEISQLDID